MNTVVATCKVCGAEVVVLAQWAAFGGYCEACIEKDHKAGRDIAAIKRREARWLRLCPTEFQDTDFSRLPCIGRSADCLRWPFEGESRPRGLMLWGVPRTGKTRTMWLILKREFFKKLDVVCFDPGRFLIAYDSHERRRGPWIDGLCHVDLLAFDDIDKFKMPRKVEDAFFAVVSHRMNYARPIFFTGNSNGESLKLKFFAGEPLIARIREFCTAIHFAFET